jgi:asparagine synthase (glutamine-hydrolysing)
MTGKAERLAAELRRIVGNELEGLDRVGVMFSGGLDSSILAVLARKHCEVMLYTLGTGGSHDLKWASECAGLMDLPLTEIICSKEDIMCSMRDVVLKHGMARAKWMSTFVSFDLVLRHVAEDQVLCGQGADEAFGGYWKYLDSPNPGEMMQRDLAGLLEEEMPEYRRMADCYGKTILTPYLESPMLDLARTMPPDMLFNSQGNKLVLRDAARIIGVPGMTVEKPKKAMQYGSGVSAAMRRIIRDSGTDLDGFIESLVKLGK